MALACICTIFVGCTQTPDTPVDSDMNETESSEDTADETGGQTDTPVEFVMTEGGESKISIWVDQTLYSTSDELRTYAKKLEEQFELQAGVSISSSGDRYFTDEDDQNPAILIGSSDKSADQLEFDEELKLGDFVLAVSGNKIIIYSDYAEGCVTGIKYFINKILIPQGNVDKLIFNSSQCLTYHSEYGISSIECLGEDLYKYSIVIPKNADLETELLAYTFKQHLRDNYGHEIEVVTDDTAESEYEILIGDTSRTTAEPVEDGYTVLAANKKLQICADGMLGYENVWKYLKKTLFASTYEAEYTLNEGFVTNGEAVGELSDGTYFISEREGDVRYMVYNVYGYGEGAPMNVRMEFQKEIVSAYLPDVIGFQEYTTSYHSKFTPVLLELGYTQVPVSTKIDGKEYLNYTPMFYRADKVTLKDSGFFIHFNNSTDYSKSATWGVFETLSGKQFGAIATHFMWSGDPSEPNYLEVRKDHAAKIVELKDSIVAKHGVPVLFGGDLNCSSVSDPVKILMDGGFTLAQTAAPEGAKNDNNGHHEHPTYNGAKKYFTTLYMPTGKYTASIDHILVSGNVTVSGFATICSPYAAYSSDHSPLMVDVTLP